jgi:transcriptional regulator with XRE-family HTH domain
MSIKIDFAKWLAEQMHQRQWTQAQLANRAGITPAALSRVLSRERYPGVEMCRGLAQALNLKDYQVLQLAGLIATEPARLTPAAAELVNLFLMLDDEGQEELLYLARFKARKQA